MTVTLRRFRLADAETVWQLAFASRNAAWRATNAPYFQDPVPTHAAFLAKWAPRWHDDPWVKLICLDTKPIGLVTAYFEDGELQRWLEVGIVLYDADAWGHHLGRQALKLWLSELFVNTDLPHIGLTTWSGNPRMMALAEALGMQQEARIRQVRYWQGQYFDSVKYGILRHEWRQD